MLMLLPQQLTAEHCCSDERGARYGRSRGGLLYVLGAKSFPLYVCESLWVFRSTPPHPQYRRMTGCATWTQATCQACSPQALSPRESLEVSCSEAVLWPLSPIVSPACFCTSSSLRGCRCALVMHVYSRSTRAPPLEWSRHVADVRSQACAACQAPIRADPSISSTLFGLHETDPLKFGWSESVPVFVFCFVFLTLAMLHLWTMTWWLTNIPELLEVPLGLGRLLYFFLVCSLSFCLAEIKTSWCVAQSKEPVERRRWVKLATPHVCSQHYRHHVQISQSPETKLICLKLLTALVEKSEKPPSSCYHSQQQCSPAFPVVGRKFTHNTSTRLKFFGWVSFPQTRNRRLSVRVNKKTDCWLQFWKWLFLWQMWNEDMTSDAHRVGGSES